MANVPPYKANGTIFTEIGTLLTLVSLPGSLALLLEEKTRREEIAYFTLARALRSLYVYFKRRDLLGFAN